MEKFKQIYETMLGLLEPEACIPGVENAFADGSFCAEQYEKMRSAYERLCTRQNVGDEDRDLNTIVDSMEAIQKVLCRRFYIHNKSTDG